MENKETMRRFKLRRTEDASGVSGTGYVAEGVKFGDGTCVIRWLTDTSSMGIYHSPVEMIHIHGHAGKTIIEWVDNAETKEPKDQENLQEEKDTKIELRIEPNTPALAKEEKMAIKDSQDQEIEIEIQT